VERTRPVRRSPPRQSRTASRPDSSRGVRRSAIGGPPTVSFPAADRVTVGGAIRDGSSSCDRIVLESVTYADGTLDVTVAAASKESDPATCTDDIAAGEYTVDVSLSNGLPAEVVVTEDGFESTETHTATPS